MGKRKRMGKRRRRIDRIFHEMVACRRADMRLTQAAVEKTGRLRVGLVSYIETGRMVRLPLPDVLHGLCLALDLSERDLLIAAGYVVDEDADILHWPKTAVAA